MPKGRYFELRTETKRKTESKVDAKQKLLKPMWDDKKEREEDGGIKNKQELGLFILCVA